MRRQLPGLFPLIAVVALVAVHPAGATVRDEPVLMSILDPPGELESGQSHIVTLSFEAYRDATIDRFEVDGAGWIASPLDGEHARDLLTGETAELRYELVPLDPEAPLEFRYRVDGHPHESEFNPKETFWRPRQSVRIGDSEPRKLVSRDLWRPEPSPPTPPLSEQDPQFAAKANDPATKTTTIRLVGRIVHGRQLDASDPNTQWIDLGADGATVRVFDQNRYIDLELASGVTDENGYFDITFTWYTWPLSELYPDLYLRYESASSVATVRPLNIIHPYSWETQVHHDFNGTYIDFGEQRAPWDAAALQILTSLTRARRWFQDDSGVAASGLFVFWPDGDTGAWYSTPSGSMHISTERTWREDTHAHEYGHHLSYRYIDLPPPQYDCDDPCGDDNGCGHCMWCEENPSIAWTEGFANWIADVVTRRWEEEYPVPPQYFRESDTVGKCSTYYDDPWSTEGYFQALLHDIEDPYPDNDPVAPGFWDRLSLGTDEILDLHLDGFWPYTPEEFIDRMMSRYPQHKRQLWETARNCGYTGIDEVPPSTPIPTPTSNHGPTPSPDTTISISWPDGWDELSGIGGYSFLLSEGSPQAPLLSFPSVSAGIRTYESESLSPGTYYFTLRAFDREGNPDPGYVALGPLAVAQPEPGDLSPYAGLGWSYPVVPRSAADVDISVPAPTAVLQRNTYWNMNIINSGDINIPSGTRTAVLVDGLVKDGVAAPLMYAFGHEDRTSNRGPISIAGGRHTFEGRTDLYEIAAEGNETNNDWGKQWIWNPEIFLNSPTMDRSSPPVSTAGWSSIESGVLWYNCDGLRFIAAASPGVIAAVMMVPDDRDDDYDIRLHDLATDAVTGFSSNLGYSGRPAGMVEAVLVNTSNRPAAGYDVGVLNHEDHLGAGYHAEVLYAQALSIDVPVASELEIGEHMDLYKFEISAADAGPQSIQLAVDTTWSQAPVHLAWYDQAFATGDLLDYDAVAVTGDTGYVQIDINAQPGLHGLVIWRDPDGTSLSTRSYTLTVGEPPADLSIDHPAGWAAPLVPRPAADATYSSAPAPTTLPGDQTSTYLNYAFINRSTGQAGPFRVATYVDGSLKHFSSLTHLPGGMGLHVLPQTPYFVTGGRHTTTLKVDYQDVVAELVETNNVHGWQYVWTPTQLVLDLSVQRAEPGDRSAFWETITTNDDIWYNCDGVRTPAFSQSGDDGYWGVVATMPNVFSDVDLRLHSPSGGANDGFGPSLAHSYWPPGQSDFVLMNFNYATVQAYDAGVVSTPASKLGTYKVVTGSSTYGTVDPDGAFGPFTLEIDALVDLHEFRFLTTGHYRATVNPWGSGIDVGISLYGPSAEYYGKSSVFEDPVRGPAMAMDAGPDEPEEITFEITQGGYYCLAVWKVSSNESNLEMDYSLLVEPVVNTAVDDGTPLRTRLSGVYPNPFNPRTRVEFELAREEQVDLGIFDLRGRLVRVLRREFLTPGVHHVDWDGVDDAGDRVASGSYLVRLRAGEVVQTRTVTMLK